MNHTNTKISAKIVRGIHLYMPEIYILGHSNWIY